MQCSAPLVLLGRSRSRTPSSPLVWANSGAANWGYALLACCYAANTRRGPAPAIGIAVVAGSLALANVVPAVLSLSGIGDVARPAASWTVTFERRAQRSCGWPGAPRSVQLRRRQTMTTMKSMALVPGTFAATMTVGATTASAA
ncbi:hypothetical protein [Nonomuraea typhae]|uniref:hypothetical protein n=1 Tax=Nonomuraea typhae TaxID=2603600 RepID=UPI0012FB0123|nr:hypothetical protein [Nonomuraea typhae]